MLRVKLVRIKSNHQKIRTDEVVGKTTHIPKVGERFTMFAPPLEEGLFRTVFTTPVQTRQYDESERAFTFTTENSEYALYVLDDEKDPFEYERLTVAPSRKRLFT